MDNTNSLLFSFFTRTNPDGDIWVTQGFGPMRRKIENPKRWSYGSS